MAGYSEIDVTEELKGIRHKIRETLQVLQIQYGMVEQAVDQCVTFEKKKDYSSCRIGAKNAKNQLKNLIETSERLVKEVHDLNDYVSTVDFFKIS